MEIQAGDLQEVKDLIKENKIKYYTLMRTTRKRKCDLHGNRDG